MIGEISVLKREVNLQFEQQKKLIMFALSPVSMIWLFLSVLFFLWIASNLCVCFALSVRSYLEAASIFGYMPLFKT